MPVLRGSSTVFSNGDPSWCGTAHGGRHTILCSTIVVGRNIRTIANRYEDRVGSNTLCRGVCYNTSRIPVTNTIKSGKVVVPISITKQVTSVGVAIQYSAIPIAIRFGHGIDGVCVFKDEGGGNQMIMRSIKTKNLQAIQTIRDREMGGYPRQLVLTLWPLPLLSFHV